MGGRTKGLAGTSSRVLQCSLPLDREMPAFSLWSRPLALGITGFALTLLALQNPAPLFVNFGAGDDSFARGFRSGWERDGTDGAGETTFHWTKDGSRIELPVRVLGGSPQARVRLARFLDSPVETTLWAHGVVLHRWRQDPGGWSEATIPLTQLRGPLSLLMRVHPEEGEKLGVALDWMEIRGVTVAWPRVPLFVHLAVLFVGIPLVAGALLGRRAATAAALALVLLGPVVVLLDRFAGIVSLGETGLPAVVVVAVLAMASRGFRRLGVDVESARPFALVTCLAAFLALFQPFFYYPDVDTHARFVDAIARDPKTAWDPTPYQMRFRAWTRGIGDKTIAFPYSPVFHLLALPLRPLVGSVAAVKTVAVTGVGTSLLALFALGAMLGLPMVGRFIALGLFATMPVLSSRLSLALFPALLAQALELCLAVYFVRWCGRDKPSLAALVGALFITQVAYTGSLFTVASFVMVLGLTVVFAGQPGKAARLWTGEAIAAVAVIALLYLRFVPVFLRDVLPASGAATAEGSAWRRLVIFYGVVYPALSVLGLFGITRAPAWARRVVASVLVAGAALLSLRYVVPGLLRDVKDVELLAGPIALLSAAALVRLWDQGKVARVVACTAALLAILRGAHAGIVAYAERFVAVGR